MVCNEERISKLPKLQSLYLQKKEILEDKGIEYVDKTKKYHNYKPIESFSSIDDIVSYYLSNRYITIEDFNKT